MKETDVLEQERQELEWHEKYDRKSILLKQEINRLLQEKTESSRQKVVGIFGNREFFDPYKEIPEFAFMYVIIYIYQSERQKGIEETILDHGDTMEELEQYFFRWRTLLYRLDFDVEEDVEELFLVFLTENKVSPVMIWISLKSQTMRPAQLEAKMERIFEENGLDTYLDALRKAGR